MLRDERAIGGKGKKGALNDAALLDEGAGHALRQIGGIARFETCAEAGRKPVQIDLSKLFKLPVCLAVGDLQGELCRADRDGKDDSARSRRQAERRREDADPDGFGSDMVGGDGHRRREIQGRPCLAGRPPSRQENNWDAISHRFVGAVANHIEKATIAGGQAGHHGRVARREHRLEILDLEVEVE